MSKQRNDNSYREEDPIRTQSDEHRAVAKTMAEEHRVGTAASLNATATPPGWRVREHRVCTAATLIATPPGWRERRGESSHGIARVISAIPLIVRHQDRCEH